MAWTAADVVQVSFLEYDVCLNAFMCEFMILIEFIADKRMWML